NRCQVGREQKIVGVARLEQLHDERHLLGVALAALTVEADERAAAANHPMDLDVWIARQIAEVADRDMLGIDSDILEEVELFDRRLSRHAPVREDRQGWSAVRAAHGAEDLAFIFRDVVPRTDPAECSPR